MTTPTSLTVNGITIPKEDEKALFDAYRQDRDAYRQDRMEGIVAAAAVEFDVTIELYEPDRSAVWFGAGLTAGKEKILGASERASIARPAVFGKGIPVARVLYDKNKQRYEILKIDGDTMARSGAIDGTLDSLVYSILRQKWLDVTVGRLQNEVPHHTDRLRTLESDADPSDDDIRARLKEGGTLGENVQDELRWIGLNRPKSIKNIQKLIGHLKEEWQAKSKFSGELTGIGDYLARNKHLLLGREPQVMNAEGTGYDKLANWSQEKLNQLYARLQNDRLKILKHGYSGSKKWQEQEVYKDKLIKGSEDYKAIALAAILDDGKLDNERFRQVTTLMASVDPEKLKKRYMRLRGATEMDRLETELKAKFHQEGNSTSPLRRITEVGKYFSDERGDKLQFPYLKSLLETGQESASGRLALRLGLMYKGFNYKNLSESDKNEIRKLVMENPGELAGLADTDESGNLKASDDPLLAAAYDNLKKHHSGLLGDLKSTLSQSDQTAAIAGVDIARIGKTEIPEGPAKSLIGYMYNFTTGAERRHGDSLIIKTDTAPLKKKLLEWIKDCSHEDLLAFIDAGAAQKASKPPTPYQQAWALIDSQLKWGADRGDWRGYFVGMARARLLGQETEDIQAFFELEAFLKYKKSRGGLLGYWEKKDTLAKVLNTLSASPDWDPMARLADFVKTNPRLKDLRKYRDDPTEWLHDVLKDAGVDAEGREQVDLLLYAGGTYNGDEATDATRNIDNYLSLKRKAHRSFIGRDLKARGLSVENILTTVGKIKPGSLDHWLVRKDRELLLKIHKKLLEKYADDLKKRQRVWNNLHQALDLGKKWEWEELVADTERLDRLMPIPPSADELKAFKDRYKGSEKRKRLWSAKYALTYHLGKDQSLFNISDKKELLKVIYEGQLEGYQGDELVKILDGVDLKIRRGLEKDPPTMWTNHEKAAHALLKKFVVDGLEIGFGEFLSVAEGLFSNDYSAIDFAINDLPPEKSVKLWCSKSYGELRGWCDARLEKVLTLHRIEAGETGEPSEAAKNLKAEIAALDAKIRKHTFTIDDERKGQLKTLTRDGKAADFERKIKRKIGEAMLSEPEKFDDLNIPAFDLSRKAGTLLAETNVDYQHYLASGVGYHRLSSSGLESYAEMSGFMRNLWKTARSTATGTAEEREKEEEELLKSLKKSHESLLGSLDQWKDKQDEYTKRIVDIVDKTLTVAVGVALAATGVGGLALTIIGPIKAAAMAAAKKSVEAALSRQGDVLAQDALKEALVGAVASIPSAFASYNYGEGRKLADLINNRIASAAVKGQISSISKAIAGGVGNILAAGGSGDFDMSSQAFKKHILDNLQNYNITQPQIYQTVLGALSSELNQLATSGIKTGIINADEDASGEKSFKDLPEDKKAELTREFKPLQSLYASAYGMTISAKGHALLASSVNLSFPDAVEVDKNKIEEEKKRLVISNALVRELAAKGLRVDASFDYGDPEKLMEQIAKKMPGVAATPESFANDLKALKARFETEYPRVAAVAEKQAEEDRKALETDVTAMADGNAMKKTLEENKSDDRKALGSGGTAGDDARDIVARSLAARLYGKKDKKSKQNRKEIKKKVEAQWRQRREKKEKALAG
uniref:Uncharacterized protein n=1 Tax=Candidatus Kentrum sp. SD TaxID=2126332 RepID=A0A450Y4K6_9GAMM|nr:MAG: hypothetical protein BECKSD772F_GA0070984_100211 [Candidatus Kentron sp. SD]VFK39120.1 MAG: hypothetical protein BECKSD772E_GA0070983_100211 [Candidatus Kentron sp. SD]